MYDAPPLVADVEIRLSSFGTVHYDDALARARTSLATPARQDDIVTAIFNRIDAFLAARAAPTENPHCGLEAGARLVAQISTALGADVVEVRFAPVDEAVGDIRATGQLVDHIDARIIATDTLCEQLTGSCDGNARARAHQAFETLYGLRGPALHMIEAAAAKNVTAARELVEAEIEARAYASEMLRRLAHHPLAGDSVLALSMGVSADALAFARRFLPFVENTGWHRPVIEEALRALPSDNQLLARETRKAIP